MSIGLTNAVGRPLFDPDQAPWSSQHVKVKEWKPRSAELASEVMRRWATYNWVNHISTKPRPKKCGVERSTTWLNDHPIDWPKHDISDWHEDVEFIVAEMKRRKDQMEKVCASIAEQNAALEGRWIGKEPILWLIHCLIEDDAIKSAFIHCHNSKDGMQLDS
jgi:hypothetical protein